MTSLKTVVLGLSLVPLLSFATHTSDVSPKIVQLKVGNVSREGTVLRKIRQHPFTRFLVGIPLDVTLKDACTDYVGQQDVTTSVLTRLLTLGAKDPLNDICIDVLPAPVNTQLTLEMNVLTGGFVPAQRFQHQMVELSGAGTFDVTLDMDTMRVTITPAI